MNRQELEIKINELIINDREDCERGKIHKIKDIVDDILMNVDFYIERNYEEKE